MDSEAFEIARGLYNSKGIVFGRLTVYVDNSILHDKLNYARKFLLFFAFSQVFVSTFVFLLHFVVICDLIKTEQTT